MKVEYIGMFDEVVVPEWLDERTGYPKTARKGEPVEVPDALGARLCEQEANWRAVDSPAGRRRNTEATTTEE